ncbi:mucin-5AC [Scaptodrosophila lebanonensis]|uniref:Mucin-5AC n=1 Tax=Drosophila lebanonensis TaxID=7225 RepID=A0A6J2T0V1_DROLE|nr:mucin-5AC [Scaptodrosophila lebanonensis]
MTPHNQLAAAGWLCLLLTATIVRAQDTDPKWSRQLDAVESTETDSLDWVPLAQPLDGSKDRSANGRVLTYSQSFPPNGRFGELPKTSQTGGAPFDFPFQFQRFPNAPLPAQPLRQVPQALKSSGPQEPTSQSFFKFEMPFRNDGSNNLRAGAQAPPTLQTGYQIQHSFGGAGASQASIFNSPTLFGQQQPLFPPEFHPISQKPLPQALTAHKPLHQQNYVDDILPLKTHTKPTQPSLQSVTPQVFPVDPEPESLFDLNKAAPSADSAGGSTGGVNGQQQEVQLLYVPYDTLYNQQRQQQQQSNSGSGNSNNYNVNKYNLNAGLPAVNPYQINQFYTQDPSVGNSFYSPGTTLRPSTTSTTTTALPQNVFQSYAQPQFTTAKPKPKAHQPPLAMFLLRSNARPSQSDVVSALRNAQSISVIDAPTKQTPDIFVGPAGMPIPDGYVKFDLPYLSQLAHSRDLSEIPFFVAPLSYRTPNGFNKILLPEPHVGSIVVNRAKGGSFATTQDLAPPPRPQRPYVAPVASPANTRNPFDGTTQRTPASQAPGRGNKFSYFYVQDAIQEVTSPKITKQERPKKKRPQHVQVDPPTYRPPTKSPFETINQIGNEDYFNALLNKPSTSTSTTSSTSTSTSSTTSTTSTTAAPQTLFTYSSSPHVEFPSTNGQLYPQFDTSPQAQPVQEHLPRLTTRPPISGSSDEELRMKQYFRQQDAFRQRPQTTNPPFEQVQYTPVSVEYGRDEAIPTTTQKANTKGKQRVTIYTPAAIPVTTSDVGYNVEPQKQLPLNHRPIYNQNEVLDSTNLEYEPNPYHVPSELPPLMPEIPGLVNNLQEKEKLATTLPVSEQDAESRPTRRPLLRTRKPVVSKVVTSSVSYSESESSNSKLQSHRIRRPYKTRGSAGITAVENGDNEEETTSNLATRRPTSARNPLLRNPNRIRYQPTPEERQSLKLKPKKHYTGSKKSNKNEDQDLEYQRDVLKQNYPVFKGTRRPTSPTAIPSSYDVGSTEGPASESQQVYTVTPSNSIDNGDQDVFPASLLEPMQIAQHYNEFKDNYGPGYFPNQEDLAPTEAIVRNEVNPIYTAVASTTPSTTTTTTTTRTTTEAPTTTTRRSPFIRRNYPRLRTTTTTEAPQTTTVAEERPSIRTRLPPRRVVKVRQRTRRPHHPASSTASPNEASEPVTQKQNLRKYSRYNQEQRDKEASGLIQTSRRRYKPSLQLEGQESQWSPATESSNSNSNSFKPLNPKEASPTDVHNFDNEPEIVTVGPTQEADSFEFNVAANLSGSPSSSQSQRTTIKAPNLKPEKSFAELLEEVMGKAPEELTTETSSTTFGRLSRRGKWKKNRVTSGTDNNENFETAESQNLGPQLYNALYASEKPEEVPKATTPLTPTTQSVPTLVTTTTPQPSTPEEYEVTTAVVPDVTTTVTMLPVSEVVGESATRRMDTAADVDVDDLETQPSLFSEVKKQLHTLFSIDESEDQAVTAALAAVGKRRQEYTSINRTKPTDSTTVEATEAASQAVATTAESPSNKKDDKFHKDLMQHVVYATSTSTKVTSETEICYRGRCIRSEDLPANHKLH